MNQSYMPTGTEYINHFNANDWALATDKWQLNHLVSGSKDWARITWSRITVGGKVYVLLQMFATIFLVAVPLLRAAADPENGKDSGYHDVSPFDYEKLGTVNPQVRAALNLAYHGTPQEKRDLILRVKEGGGSLDWIHLLMYDESEMKYIALKALSEIGSLDSVPHLLNFIEGTCERAMNEEGRMLFASDMQDFRAQGRAVEAVESILGEPILGADSADSGASRDFGVFLTTRGYWDEMIAAVRKAERLLNERSQGEEVVESDRGEGESSVAEGAPAVSRVEAGGASDKPDLRPSEPKDKEKGGSKNALGYILLVCVVVGGAILFKVVRR